MPLLETTEDDRAAWSGGSYEDEAVHYRPLAARVVEEAGVGPEDDVLDVGCGTGSVAVTAARRGASVTAVDLVPEMLELARETARTADVPEIEFREGDAADLPLADDAVDATLSSLGHMYADPPGDAASELLRVTRPGGRIAFTSWTPTSAYPAMGSTLLSYLAPEDLPEFSSPPFAWGDPDTVEDRLGDGVRDLEVERHTATYPALSPAQFAAETARSSGLFGAALERVDEAERDAALEDVAGAVEGFFDGERNEVRLQYLLASATVA